jgi:hypothetical protein
MPVIRDIATKSSSSFKQVAKAYPLVELHIVCDNYATHKHEDVRKGWRATSGSSRISRRRRRRG